MLNIKRAADDRPLVLIRGAGEIGYTAIEFLSQLADLNDGIRLALAVRSRGEGPIPMLMADRFGRKLTNDPMHAPNDFQGRSSYFFAPHLTALNPTGLAGVVEVVSRDQTFPMDVVFMDGMEIPLVGGRKPDLMLETTGAHVDFSTGEKAGKESPAVYLTRNPDGSIVFSSAPAKEQKKYEGRVFHLLEGINIADAPASQLLNVSAVNASRLVFTGSCTTHGVTVLIEALNRHIPGMEILAGFMNSTHSRTPSDDEDKLNLNFAPQSTGFAKAAKLVLPHVRGIDRITAIATRANVAGDSLYGLTMTIATTDEQLDVNAVLQALRTEAAGDMRNQLAILKTAVANEDKKGGLHNKKKFPINTALGLKGILNTAVIDPTQITVTRVCKDESGRSVYQVNFALVYYDNVGGFTFAYLREAGALLAGLRGLPANPISAKLPTSFQFARSGYPLAEQILGKDPLAKTGIDGSLIETFEG